MDLISKLSGIQISQKVTGALCEIGVHHGRTFVLLSLLAQPHEICLAIDLFADQGQNLDKSGCGDEDILIKNLKANHCDLSQVKLITKNSLHITPDELLDLVHQKFRFFSIDGGHSAEIVGNDLKLAETVLCNGGIILVDDYFDEKWPGVSEGTLKHLLLSHSNLIPFAIFDDKILFTNNVDLKSRYISALKKLAPRYIIKETDYMDALCLIIYSSPGKLKNSLRQTKIWQSIKTSSLGNKLRSLLKSN